MTRPFRWLLVPGLAAAALAVSCGPPTLKPVSSPDPEAACPGGRTAWSLDVLDRRAEREASEKTVALVQDSVRKSFPGCTWTAPKDGDNLPAITIEIHRFAAPYQEGMWEAAADWNVLARDASGRSLTDFDAVSEISRPNYQGSNNEKEALKQVLAEALQKTLAGLRAVPPVQ
jgi:hypothetical protein